MYTENCNMDNNKMYFNSNATRHVPCKSTNIVEPISSNLNQRSNSYSSLQSLKRLLSDELIQQSHVPQLPTSQSTNNYNYPYSSLGNKENSLRKFRSANSSFDRRGSICGSLSNLSKVPDSSPRSLQRMQSWPLQALTENPKNSVESLSLSSSQSSSGMNNIFRQSSQDSFCRSSCDMIKWTPDSPQLESLPADSAEDFPLITISSQDFICDEMDVTQNNSMMFPWPSPLIKDIEYDGTPEIPTIRSSVYGTPLSIIEEHSCPSTQPLWDHDIDDLPSLKREQSLEDNNESTTCTPINTQVYPNVIPISDLRSTSILEENGEDNDRFSQIYTQPSRYFSLQSLSSLKNSKTSQLHNEDSPYSSSVIITNDNTSELREFRTFTQEKLISNIQLTVAEIIKDLDKS